MSRKPREDAAKTAIRNYLATIAPDEGHFWASPVSTWGESGIPDRMGVFRGWSIAIEIKRENGGILAAVQVDFLKGHRRAGGVSIIARSADEVRRRLEALPWREPRAIPADA